MKDFSRNDKLTTDMREWSANAFISFSLGKDNQVISRGQHNKQQLIKLNIIKAWGLILLR